MLIIEKDFRKIKDLINIISDDIPNLKISKVCSTSSEVLKFIKHYKFDIIILNYEIDNNKLFQFLTDSTLNHYKNSIILISNNSITLKNQYTKFIFKSLNNFNINSIINSLHELIEIKKKSLNSTVIKNKIERELKVLNFNFSYIGTKYILDSIYEIQLKNYYTFNLTKDIYPILSKKYHKSVNTIKCNITNATKAMIKHSNKKIIKKYFRYLDYCTPTVKQIMEEISNKL